MHPVAAFDAYGTGSFTYTVGRLCAIMPRQRIERPVGICHHLDVALGTDEDGHLRAHLAVPKSRLGSV